MMIFIGLILLITYLVGMINGGWFTEATKEAKGFTKEKLDGMEEEEQIRYSIKIVSKVLLTLSFSILMSILYVIFLIGALSVDVILVPTIVLLLLFVYKMVRVSTSKKYREKLNNRSQEDGKSRVRLNSGIHILYVLYILVLLIV